MAAWFVPAVFLMPLARLGFARAAACGIVFGTTWGSTMAWWMRSTSVTYFGFDGILPTLFPIGVALAYAGIPNGLLAMAYVATARRLSARWRVLAGAWLWAASEVLRAHIFTGLPWELLGHTQVHWLRLIQVADLGGAYAVSFVVAFVSLSLGELCAPLAARERPALLVRRMLPATIVLMLVVGYGRWCESRYSGAPEGSVHTVAVVQGNVPNHFRWKREFFEQTLLTYTALTLPLQRQRPDLVVWPENAVSFYVEREAGLQPTLQTAASVARAGFLFGGPRLDDAGRSFVSAYLMEPTGTIAGVYDKQRLLPFAEYDPFPSRDAGTPLDGPSDFTGGAAPAVLSARDVRLGTIICYEVLFPRLVRDLVRRGAELLVNVSNDSWLDDGDGAAPRQHFSMVPFSAVATRRYLVRASASGISGFVDPYGRAYGLIARATAGVSVERIALRRDLTIYARFGDVWIAAGGLLLLVAMLLPQRTRA